VKIAVPKVPRLEIERFELRCGAQLLVSPRPGAPVCAVQTHFRGGHSLDAPGLEGTAYLAGKLVDCGTEQRSEEELAAALEVGGGSILGGATGVMGSIANASWKVLLDVLAEILTVPSYPREKLLRDRKRLHDRLLIEREDPRYQAAQLFRKLVYGEHWLGLPEHGNVESVPKIQRRAVLGFQRRNWCARRAVIAFCGDVDPKKVRRFLETKLRDWRGGQDLPPPDQSFPRATRRSALFRARRQQVHVYLGHLGICRKDPDFPALTVMDHVLGTGPGFTNRISRRLRDELGLAYTVSASIHSSAGVLPGTFTAYIGTSPEHLATAVQGFLREIRLIQDQPVSPDELELAKSYLTGSYALGFERASRRVQYMISAYRNKLPDDHLQQLVESIARITAEDVRTAARRHLMPDTPCLVAAGPVTKKDLRNALQEESPVRARLTTRRAGRSG
jgi:zinc protease